MSKPRKNFSSGQLDQLGEAISDAAGYKVSREVVFEATANLPKIPPFPTGLVFLNAILDLLMILAALASLTGVGVTVPWALRAVVWISNFFWFFGKVGPIERKIKQIALRAIMLWIIAFFVTDIVPFNDLIFPNFLLIIMIHYKETKIGKAIWDAVDKFKVSELPKTIEEAVRASKPMVIRYAKNRLSQKSERIKSALDVAEKISKEQTRPPRPSNVVDFPEPKNRPSGGSTIDLRDAA